MIIIKRIKLYHQENNYDCGVSCLLSIAKYYNCNVPKWFIEKESLTTKKGTSMYGLMVTAQKLGFKSYGLNGDIENIKKDAVPFIAHLTINKSKNLYHYVIVSSLKKDKVIIKDPSKGSKTMSILEFKKISTNNYLFIEKTTSVKYFSKNKIIKNLLKNFLKEYKYNLILIFLSFIVLLILEILNLFSLKTILNNAIIPKATFNFSILLISFLILHLLKIALNTVINIALMIMNQKFSYNLKLTLLKQLLALPSLYYQTKKQGVIISLFNDIDYISKFLIVSFFSLVNNIFLLVFINIYFFKLSKTLSLLLIVSISFLTLFIYFQRKYSYNTLTNYYNTYDLYNDNLQKIITNNERIKGLHLDDIIIKRFTKVLNNNINSLSKLNLYKEIVSNSLNLFENIIYLLILGVGGILVITTTNISLSTFILFESFIFLSLKKAEALIIMFLKFENYKKISERLKDIFSYQKEVLLPFKNYNYNTKNLFINIRNLSFNYYDKVVLNNINLRINPHDKVFIYGNSGSGKSTLVKLLSRLLPLEYGKIKFGNIDITHYNLYELRDLVTYIPNSLMLSNTTIKDNIYLSRKPSINQDELLKLTGLKELFDNNNYNLYTVIEENGENLSRGERSRIALAQALFKPSEIYILDECLSNVDIKLEKEILENILYYYKDKIIIYISHRLSNKNLFNRVFYLKEGKCYEKKTK